MKRHLRYFALTIIGLFIISCMFPASAAVYETSDVYGTGVYAQRLENNRLTGDQIRDIINVALTQVGYHEGNVVADLHGGNLYGENDYTEYGYWYGREVQHTNPYFTPWCAFFVSWCARQAAIPVEIINNSAYARVGIASCLFHVEYKDKSNYLPKPGDLIFYDYSGAGTEWHHVGLVMELRDGYVYSIEGNTSKQVKVCRHSWKSASIKGYGVPAYDNPNRKCMDFVSYVEPTSTLKPGASGQAVAWVQLALTKLGYYTPIDGNFNELTTQRVIEFQRDNGISQTGNYGPITRKAVKAMLIDKHLIEEVVPTPTSTPTPTPEPTLMPETPTVVTEYPIPERLLYWGCSGNDVKWVQYTLKQLGYDFSVTGYFASKTYNAIYNFQTRHNIAATGMCTRETVICLANVTHQSCSYVNDNSYPIPARVLSYGMRGEDVKWLQTQLNKKWASGIEVSGYYGPLTKAGVKAFQRYFDLPETGVFDNAMRAYMIVYLSARNML